MSSAQKKLLFFVVVITSVAFLAITLWSFHRLDHSNQPERPRLKVLTYPTFMGNFGPGPSLIKEFQKECNCVVEFIKAEESSVMLRQLKQLKEIDFVVGLDQFSFDEALANFKWDEPSLYDVDFIDDFKNISKDGLVAYNWAPMTFIEESENPKTYKTFNQAYDVYKNSLSIPGPNYSTAGIQFLLWGYKSENSPLKERPSNVAPGWSKSYGLFQKGKVKATFSYLTSLIYHMKEEKDFSHNVAVIEEGHPYQVEYMGVPATCKNCQVAKKFMRYMLTPRAQKFIRNKNYMFPVVKNVEADADFEKLPKLKLRPDWHEVTKVKSEAFQFWNNNK